MWRENPLICRAFPQREHPIVRTYVRTYWARCAMGVICDGRDALSMPSVMIPVL